MNSRIEKLMLEAGFVEYITETENQLTHQPIFNAEKFAELIINECVKQCEESNISFRFLFSKLIKEHFGLK